MIPTSWLAANLSWRKWECEGASCWFQRTTWKGTRRTGPFNDFPSPNVTLTKRYSGGQIIRQVWKICTLFCLRDIITFFVLMKYVDSCCKQKQTSMSYCFYPPIIWIFFLQWPLQPKLNTLHWNWKKKYLCPALCKNGHISLTLSCTALLYSIVLCANG